MNSYPVEILTTDNSQCSQMPLANLSAQRLIPGTRLVFPESGILSLSVAADSRGDCVVTLTDGNGWEAAIDASYASHAQKLRMHLPPGAKEIQVSKVQGEAELWVTSEPPLAPVVVETEADLATRRQRALEHLQQDAICQFSWMGGCVLDGLLQLTKQNPDDAWDDAIDSWLAHFYQGEDLVFQCRRGNETRNAFHGVENTLPAAIIAARNPESPVIDMALKNWRSMTKDNGCIEDHAVTAEGCYTVAYPLAVIGKLRQDPALIEAALTQLRFRRDLLCIGGDHYLRNLDGKLTFRNWTRGICWSLLGLARSLETLGADADAGLADYASERAQWIIKHQRSDGLWDNFLDEAGAGLPPDSSGSSGIGAALVAYHSLGLIGDEAITSAERCWEGLGSCLEPDGWLGSVAPNNKRGEVEQHTHRRTIEPFALGLYGQLAAALGKTS